MATLEILSEMILWAGRYPAPKTEKQWDRYQDEIREKQIVRTTSENTGTTRANPATFPDWNNYLNIWQSCEEAFAK